MTKSKRERLKKLGYTVADNAAEWLGLTPEEQKLIELRVSVSRSVRVARESLGLTQADLAARLGSTQPRVANLEAGRRGFTIDFAVKALLAMGGEVTLAAANAPRKRAGRVKA